MKSPTREVIFVAILIGLPLMAYFFVFQPANKQFEQQQQEIDAKAEKLSQLHDALNRVDDLDAEVRRLTDAMAFFEDKLPAQHEIHPRGSKTPTPYIKPIRCSLIRRRKNLAGKTPNY